MIRIGVHMMEIRVLGCHGSLLPGYHTTGFMLNRTILVDAGTVTSVLTLEEQLNLETVLITHAHLDHVKELLFLADNICMSKNEPLRVMAPQGILDLLHANLFNNVIWPDFSAIPAVETPALQFRALNAGIRYPVSNLSVTVVPVNHTVETVAYLLETDKSSIIIAGDTGPTEEVWRIARQTKNLKALFLETSFPNEMQSTADLAGHLTPASLERELEKLGSCNPDIFLYHLKPQYYDKVTREIAALASFRNLRILRNGDVLRF